MYEQIPEEMKAYNAWVCWRYEDRGGPKPAKVPYNAKTGDRASPTDRDTWSDFAAAVAAAANYNGIGFVLSKDDPYVFIDLDDTHGNQANYERQQKILAEFDSYSERSPGGNGWHIIAKGYIANGRRRSAVELYDSGRYMTMTGDVYNDKPIAERQPLITALWQEMGGKNVDQIYRGDTPETMSDDEVIKKALEAVNGEKFKTLLNGKWQGLYQSQSEADLAFVNMIAFYTQNAAQVTRIFYESPLGLRDKAKRPEYMGYMLQKCFDNMLPPIDMVALNDKMNLLKSEAVLQNIGASQPLSIADVMSLWKPTPIAPPPGLVGELAHFIYNAAPRQFPEMALCGAIGLMAGIVGRAYNVSGTGLNQYVLLLAQTGTGKEGMAGGIDKILHMLDDKVGGIRSCLGPAEIASGQALLKHLSRNNPSFVSIVGEFGIKMKQLSSPKASSSELALKRVLLDLYNKSGSTAMLGTSVYAETSKNNEPVRSPAFSLLGESTPEPFYASLDASLIQDGLLPRFMIIEYTGDRPPLNKIHDKVIMPDATLARLIELIKCSFTLQNASEVFNVEYQEDAKLFLDQVNTAIDATINSTKTDILRHLWNRAHIKTLKLAALIAVGCDFIRPCITLEIAQWSFNLVMTDVLGIVRRFERNEIGGNNEESEQRKDLVKAILKYANSTYNELAGYGVKPAMHRDGIIPLGYLSRYLLNRAAFRNDKRRATDALKNTIAHFVNCGALREVKGADLHKYDTTGLAYIVSDEKYFVS